MSNLIAIPADHGESSVHYPGWLVVLTASVGVMVSFAALVPYTFRLFITPLHDAFGRKREGISLAFGITAMSVAACSPVSATYSTAIRHEELSCRQNLCF